LSSSVYFKNGLAPGPWTVSVVGKDGFDGTVIGGIGGDLLDDALNSAPFTIAPGGVTDSAIEVNLIPIDGDGWLELTLSWGEGAIDSPVTLNAYLVPSIATDAYTNHSIVPDFTVNEAGRTATYPLTQKSTGYYTLLLQLYGNGSLTWGWAEAVRIVHGMNTVENGLQLVTGTGGLELQITSDMQNPLNVSFNNEPATLTLGDDLVITATHDTNSGYLYDYQWYLDGEPLSGKDAISITHGALLTAGDYGLNLVVTEMTNLADPLTIRTISSYGFTFSVQ